MRGDRRYSRRRSARSWATKLTKFGRAQAGRQVDQQRRNAVVLIRETKASVTPVECRLERRLEREVQSGDDRRVPGRKELCRADGNLRVVGGNVEDGGW